MGSSGQDHDWACAFWGFLNVSLRASGALFRLDIVDEMWVQIRIWSWFVGLYYILGEKRLRHWCGPQPFRCLNYWPSRFLSRFIFLLQASISVQVIEKFVSILFFFSGPLKLRVLGSSPLDLRRDCRVLAVGGALSTPRLGPLMLYCGACIVMDCIAM